MRWSAISRWVSVSAQFSSHLYMFGDGLRVDFILQDPAKK